MTEITIPLEALEAAAKDLYEAWCRVHGVADTALPWEDIDNEERDACFAEARAACLAMLKSWPGMGVSSPDPWSAPDTIILPLPKENTNAEG